VHPAQIRAHHAQRAAAQVTSVSSAQFPARHAQTTESTLPLIIVFRFSELEISRHIQQLSTLPLNQW
jgi:hypothetical protein